MTQQIIKDFAKELYEAELNAKPIEAISDRFPEITIELAYQIHQEVIKLKEQDGDYVIGKKIGLTNKAIQKQIGVFEPDFAMITSKGYIASGQSVKMSELIAPRIESELAFIFAKDLDPSMYPLTNMDILQSLRGVAAALEIVDSRVKDWKIKIFDTVSDSASYAKIVVSNKIIPIDGLDFDCIGMATYKNGELVTHGSSANVMGNPINSLTWLANKLLSLGLSIKKGEIVLSGAFTPVFPIQEGDTIYAKFDRVGEVLLKVEA